MGKKKGRAWSLLRLALLWVQKGGAFKRGLVFDLRLLPGYLKSLKPGGGHSDRLHYGEREFSFDETPDFHFKTPSMRLPRLPCITPAADFDNDDDYIFFKCEKTNEFFDKESKEECSMDRCEGGEDDDDKGINCGELIEVEEEQGIDSKAEEFIAKFYEEMKLQRQFSLLQYNEMLRRGMS
ncbi:uncharacterized protein [Elaeis guineensis]|uniref:uncharacterized protein n=1 Tax=Elaeis guineensis var. tenera TaxID=51953 RepID=UPI003C6D4C1D